MRGDLGKTRHCLGPRLGTKKIGAGHEKRCDIVSVSLRDRDRERSLTTAISKYERPRCDGRIRKDASVDLGSVEIDRSPGASDSLRGWLQSEFRQKTEYQTSGVGRSSGGSGIQELQLPC